MTAIICFVMFDREAVAEEERLAASKKNDAEFDFGQNAGRLPRPNDEESQNLMDEKNGEGKITNRHNTTEGSLV